MATNDAGTSNDQRHYIVTTLGTHGDLYPFLSLAKTLQALGRRVTFMTTPDYADWVQQAGLEFVAIGSTAEYQQALSNPDIWHPRKGLRVMFTDYAARLLRGQKIMRDFCAEHPVDTIIAHPLTVPGVAMLRDGGYVQSVVGVYLAPSNFKTCSNPMAMGDMVVPHWLPQVCRRALWWVAEKWFIDPLTMPHINSARQTLGLPRIDQSYLTHMAHAPNLRATLFPRWFRANAPDWPQPLVNGNFVLADKHAAAALSPELKAFLASGLPPIVFTAGTGNIHAHRFFATAAKVLTRLGLRGVFLTKERSQLSAELPESILWQDYVPMHLLLPHSAVLVHHGGIGTTAEALRCGTPQLVVPFAWDQFDNAAVVKQLGVGSYIRASRLWSYPLARALRKLTTCASMQQRCAELTQHFETGYDLRALCLAIEQQTLITR